jgi:hypothetical protein
MRLRVLKNIVEKEFVRGLGFHLVSGSCKVLEQLLRESKLIRDLKKHSKNSLFPNSCDESYSTNSVCEACRFPPFRF